MTVPVLTPRAAREQKAFRALLDAMARPGTIASVGDDVHPGMHGAAVTLLESLLDHEVSFAVVPADAALEETLLRLTGSHHEAIERADYVLATDGGLAAALSQAKEGQPEYPDRNATIIAAIASVSNGGGPGERLLLSGPGIDGSSVISVQGFRASDRELLRERNAELPLGLDLVLVAPDGAFACLPRYTRIQEES